MMERLTERTKSGKASLKSYGTVLAYEQAIDCLAYYEDMEEQGRLAVLPCKVGDTLFFVRDGEIYSGVFRYAHWDNHKDYGVRSEIRINITPYATMGASFDEIGKTVFLTREEAENSLATDKNVGSKNGGAE